MEKRRLLYRAGALGFLVVFALALTLSAGFYVRAANASPEEDSRQGVAVPILMYHSVLKHPTGKNIYVVSEQTFRNDMIYLKEHGYTAIFVSDVVNYVYNGTPLPEKPIIITLDDGYLNGLTYVLPILEETDMKAVISVVGLYSEESTAANDPNPGYAYLSWEDIGTLSDSGRVEIGNHTYNMHSLGSRRGAAKKSGETEQQYQEKLRADLTKTQQLLKENAGIEPKVFTYPYGFVSPASIAVLKELGFTAALTCDEQVNYLTGDPEQLYDLGRFNRASGSSTAQFMKRIGL